MSFPKAWVRCIELADARLRMMSNRYLHWGQDEDPQEAIDHLLAHGLFSYELSTKRTIYLNGGTEPERIQVRKPVSGPYDLVLEPGMAKMVYREFTDLIATPNGAISIMSTEREAIQALETELARIGYDYRGDV